ncbi:MAG: hypothetical protein JJT82_02505 [Legionellaceae bacterium]|nr:hypothetical protein [Legionellaceae bacterium]
MNEMDVLDVFYDTLKAESKTRNTLFMSLDESVVAILQQKLGEKLSLEELHQYADICLANEWLERTTADPEYKYLSLTEAGLQIILAHRYRG